MLKATTETELMAILKKYASRNDSLNEANDLAQSNYINAVKKEREEFGYSLDEQEKEEEEAEEEEAESPEKEKEKEVQKEPSEEESQVDNEEFNSKTFTTSFDSITKDINNLRAGRSIKDKEIKSELSTYYDRLDEDERKILHIFLKQLSSILQGAIEGSDAVDPSDPPHNADVTFDEKEKSTQANGEESLKAKSQTPQRQKPKTGSREDITPPITVGDKQDLNEISLAIQKLMKN